MNLKCSDQCALSADDGNNDNTNSNNIIFTIKDTKFYVPARTLSAKDNQKLRKLLSKRSEELVYLN